MNVSNRIYDLRWISAIRKGLLSIFPLILIGTFSTLIKNLPIAAFQNFMDSLFGQSWTYFLGIIIDSTFNMMALFLAFSISYFNVTNSNSVKNGKLSAITISIISCISFLVVSPMGSLELWRNNLGVSGLFIAIVIALLSSELFLLLAGSRLFRLKRIQFTEEPILKQVLVSILPAAIVVAFFMLLNILMILTLGMDFNQLFFKFLTIFSTDNELRFGFLNTFFNQLFWFFGIHGNDVLYQIFDNTGLAHSGVIMNLTFFNVFVLIGGSGATICMIIAIMLSLKKSNTFRIARLSLLPGLFNINEIMTLGIPIVLNPIFLIPFILGPIVLMLISYLAILTGIVPPATVPVAWTTPPLLGGYLATGSIRGLLLQLFNILIGTLIYLPFVRLNEKQKDKIIRDIYNQMVEQLKKKDILTGNELFARNDRIGNLARDLANDLRDAIEQDELVLEYQPQIDSTGRTIGVEALLRWPHERFGRIPPQVTVTLAEESGMMYDLGRWVVSRACVQLAEWNRNGIQDLRMSINISPTQLSDDKLPEILAELISKYNLDPACVELEITEGVAIELDQDAKRIIEKITTMGVTLAMDDFGMGYTSLLYIRYFNINTIKIDGSLTKNLLHNKACQDIISSMVYLCNTMNIKIIAEYVETEMQKEVLKSLGCTEYQGFLFSPPLPAESCYEFIKKNEASVLEANTAVQENHVH